MASSTPLPGGWARWFALLGFLLAAACASEAPPASTGDDGNNGGNNGASNNGGDNNGGGNNGASNNGTSNNGNNGTANNGVHPATAEFGEPCRSNLDCVSGFCITSPQGFVCTEACQSAEDCPALGGAPMDCQPTQNFGADGINICTPTDSSLCSPCFQDGNCFGGACVPTASGSVCGLDCDEGSCPTGTTCFQFSPLGDALPRPQCLPTNLSCGCDTATHGRTRPCVRTGEDGNRCFGEETCDAEQGWVGCDAATPSLEVCDGQDNDCNGAIDDGLGQNTTCERTNEHGTCTGVQVCRGVTGVDCLAVEPAAEICDLRDNDCDDLVDEDFKNADGLLVDPTHCGTCGNDCDTRFPLALETECRVTDGAAACAITRCPPGYLLAGPTTCLPLASRLCEPCTTDAECNAQVGDRCVTYDNGQGFCGRDCSPDSPFGASCPSGYTCNADAQCELETGTCLCGPNDNFIRACSIPDPNDPAVSCVGQLTCTNGALSACVPPEDACNGVDDDCNGTIDDGARDAETGRYVADTHCGRCYNDCTSLFANPMFHAAGVCSGLEAARRGEIPACVLDCDDGYRDVNGTTVDGCECVIQTPNADDPDPMGIDADCDGIDGQIPRGVFVSPTGDDNAPGTIDAPLRHIQTGINLAGGGRDHVYVAAGVYDESITLRVGVSVFGGYSANFAKRDLAGNETAIFGRPATMGRPGAVNAIDIRGTETILSGFTIVGADNRGLAGNSYGVYARGSGQALHIRHNTIRAGNGGPGQNGSSGTGAANAPDTATTGQARRLAAQRECATQNQNRSLGGNGGTNSCTDQLGNTIQASGGNGGTADCPDYDTAEASGLDGLTQPDAGEGGHGGYSSLFREFGFNQCYCLVPNAANATGPGVPGTDGLNGAGGEPGQGCGGNPGLVLNGQWVAGAARPSTDLTYLADQGWGGQGWKGLPGGGGGGGGAGAGIAVEGVGQYFSCPTNLNEAIGGGGGGGGAGGCGGGGGTGGGPGGASIALFVIFDTAPGSLPRIHDNRIERGTGGDGGDGGAGAAGGDGALGKIGLDLSESQLQGLMVCADPGGRGGDGGDGGAGGGGGGGCGGISAGIYVAGHNGLPTAAYRSANDFPSTGRGGLGGQAGASIGRSGSAGAAGFYNEVVP